MNNNPQTITLSLEQWNALASLAARAPMLPAEDLWLRELGQKLQQQLQADTKDAAETEHLPAA